MSISQVSGRACFSNQQLRQEGGEYQGSISSTGDDTTRKLIIDVPRVFSLSLFTRTIFLLPPLFLFLSLSPSSHSDSLFWILSASLPQTVSFSTTMILSFPLSLSPFLFSCYSYGKFIFSKFSSCYKVCENYSPLVLGP